MHRRVLAALATALLLTACGSGDDGDSASNGTSGGSSDDNATAIASIAGQIEDETGLAPESAQCVAGAMVDGIGVEGLQEGGLIDEDLKLVDDPAIAGLSESDATAAADAFTGCVDIVEFAQNALGEDATPEVLGCVESALSEDDLHTAMKASFMGDTATAGGIMQELFACMTEGG